MNNLAPNKIYKFQAILTCDKGGIKFSTKIYRGEKKDERILYIIMQSDFQYKDFLTVFNIPISLWVQNGTHLFHKNTSTLVDKNGKRLCIKVS